MLFRSLQFDDQLKIAEALAAMSWMGGTDRQKELIHEILP